MCRCGDRRFSSSMHCAWFLARWAKRLSGKEVANVFHITGDSVYRAVAMAVAWGLAHRNLDGVTAMGIDEIAWITYFPTKNWRLCCNYAVLT